MGIRDKQGNLDLDVLRAFADYSRDHWHTVPDYKAVRAHLAKLLPDKFNTIQA